jgi:hypothetical protein
MLILAAVMLVTPCACLAGRKAAFNLAIDLHAEPPVYLSFGKGTAMVCQVCGDAAN